MKNILPIQPIIKPLHRNSQIKIASLQIPENKAGKLSVKIKGGVEDSEHILTTELRNQYDKLLGSEDFSLYEGRDHISGLYIVVSPEYRRRNYFLGEILRLTSIIEMIENKVKSIDIVSKASAIFFHSKYKFKPNIKNFSERNNLLQTVANDTSSKNQDLTNRAKTLLESIKNSQSPEEQREFCKSANKILFEYITRAFEDPNTPKPKFNNTMNMILTRETLIENKEFFNNLFKKHGIDYKI